MRFKVKLDKWELPLGHPVGWPTYAVLVDGVEIGTVKRTDHNRFRDAWTAWGTNGKEVCQALTRKHAADGLLLYGNQP